MIGCARQSSPTGGAVDNDPPEVLNYDPPLFKTHFSKSGFVIEFDEYVKTDGMSSQLVISPPLKKLPDYSIRGKRLIVNWQDTLQENATYQFNFGSALVDINEGNPKSDLVYVFSTGDYIDSLMVTGSVVDVLDNNPLPGAAVMLYKGEADSLPITGAPDYYSITDEAGNFKIKYLPEGDFKIFALHEEQKNYMYNGPPEKIGFLEERVLSSLNDTTDLILLRAFIEKDTSQYVVSRKETDFGYYEMAFNIPVEDPEISFMDVETEESLETINLITAGRDTLKSWVMFPDRDNFEEAAVLFRDDTTFIDTAYWYIESNPRYKQKAELKITSNTSRNKIDLEKAFTFDFNNPIIEVDTSLIYLMEDSVRVFPDEFKQHSNNRKMSIPFAFKAASRYSLKADPGAFKDIFGLYSDSLSIQFSLQEEDFYGSLSVTISPADNNDPNETKILQLMDSKGTVISERSYTNQLSFTFKRLSPGKYNLKVIFDKNGNGKWDTGVYRDKVQAEALSIYPEEIEVRSNWEFDVEWTPVGLPN